MKYGSKSSMQTNSTNLSGQFTIGDMAAVKRILAGHMYSFPIQTLVQEYLSNARDALRAAGNPSDKIVVNLPKRTDLRWSVRDYGIGMDEETVSKVFTSYGVSTKRGDNAQTGGFGVGSKSAFAYTSTFIVKAFKDGIRREFIMATETADSPAGGFLKTVEESTTEPNGVEISIPVDAKDIDAFIAATKRAIEFWENKPEVIGAPVTFVTPAVVTEHSEIFTEKRGRSIFFIIDGIPYACPDEMYSVLSAYGSSSEFEKLHDIVNGSVGLRFSTGELIPASSREAILDSKENREAIEKKAGIVFKEIMLYIEKTLESHSIEDLFKNSKKIESTFSHSFNNQVTVGGETFSYDNRGVFIFGKGINVKVLSRPHKRGYRGSTSGELRVDTSYDASRAVKYSENEAIGINATTKDFKFISVDEIISNADIIRKLNQNFPTTARFILISSESNKNKLDMLAAAFDAVCTSALEFTKPERAKRATGLVSFMTSMSERGNSSIEALKISKYVYVNTDDKTQMAALFKNLNLDGFIRSTGYLPRGFSLRTVKQLTEAGVELVKLDDFLSTAVSVVSERTKRSIAFRHVEGILSAFLRANHPLISFIKQNAAHVDQRLVNAVLNFEDRRKNNDDTRRASDIDWSYVPEGVTKKILEEYASKMELDINSVNCLSLFTEKMPLLKMMGSTLTVCDPNQKADLLDYINQKARGVK
jgi:hypothetical protein